MFCIVVRSISSLFASQSPNGFADQVGGEYRKGEQHGDQQLPCGQGGGAQYASPKVEEYQLNGKNGKHYGAENGILAQVGKDVQSIGTGVEAIEYRGEDEQPEKGGQQVDAILGGAKECRDGGRFEKIEAKCHGKSPQKQDLIDHIAVENGLVAAFGWLSHVVCAWRLSCKGKTSQGVHNQIDPKHLRYCNWGFQAEKQTKK